MYRELYTLRTIPEKYFCNEHKKSAYVAKI
jgi:hypothetical protein